MIRDNFLRPSSHLNHAKSAERSRQSGQQLLQQFTWPLGARKNALHQAHGIKRFHAGL